MGTEISDVTRAHMHRSPALMVKCWVCSKKRRKWLKFAFIVYSHRWTKVGMWGVHYWTLRGLVEEGRDATQHQDTRGVDYWLRFHHSSRNRWAKPNEIPGFHVYFGYNVFCLFSFLNLRVCCRQLVPDRQRGGGGGGLSRGWAVWL